MDAVASGLDWDATVWWIATVFVLSGLGAGADFLIRRQARRFMPGGERRFALAVGLQTMLGMVALWFAPLALDLAIGLPSTAFPFVFFGYYGAAWVLHWLVGLIPQVRALRRDYWIARRRAWERPRDWTRPRALDLPGR
jgi:hypothetical protein